jgi:hypothetical protein
MFFKHESKEEEVLPTNLNREKMKKLVSERDKITVFVASF